MFGILADPNQATWFSLSWNSVSVVSSVNYNIVAGRMFCGKLTSFQLWWRHVHFIGSLVYSTIRVCDGNLFTRLQRYQDGCKQTLPSVTFSVWLVVTISWPQWDRAEGMFGFVVTVIVMWNIRYILLIFLYTIVFFVFFFHCSHVARVIASVIAEDKQRARWWQMRWFNFSCLMREDGQWAELPAIWVSGCSAGEQNPACNAGEMGGDWPCVPSEGGRRGPGGICSLWPWCLLPWPRATPPPQTRRTHPNTHTHNTRSMTTCSIH